MNDYGANYFINLIASLYVKKLVSFLNFLKLQVSETCSQLLMRLRRILGSFQESLEIGYMNENPTINTPYILPQGVADGAVELLRRYLERQGSEWPGKAEAASISASQR